MTELALQIETCHSFVMISKLLLLFCEKSEVKGCMLYVSILDKKSLSSSSANTTLLTTARKENKNMTLSTSTDEADSTMDTIRSTNDDDATYEQNGTQASEPSTKEDQNLEKKPNTPIKPAWSSLSTGGTGNTTTEKHHQPSVISFADIMNDQSNDRNAARVVDDDVTLSLAQIQTEQERIFASLSQPEKQSTNIHNTDTGNTVVAHSDEEELRLIEMVMRQSLAESNNNNNDNTNNNDDTEDIKPPYVEQDNFGYDKNPAAYVCAEDSKPPSSVDQGNFGYDKKPAASTSAFNTKNNDNNNNVAAAFTNTVTTSATASAAAGTSNAEDEEKEMIEAAIREADEKEQRDNCDYDKKPAASTSAFNTKNNDNNNNVAAAFTNTVTASAAASAAAGTSNTEDVEKEMIEAVIREADAKERQDDESESLRLVMQLQQEELTMARRQQRHQQETAVTGNVRTMTRAAFEAEREGAKNVASNHLDNYETYENERDTGFRMNSEQQQQQPLGWYRRDRNTIVGPDNEVRTKHDTKVQGQTNATFLDLDVVDDDTGRRAHIGNTAFNAFRKTVADHAKGGQRSTTKGVATHGTGRAGSDADATKGGAMDQNVRLHISRAINTGLIERCNGAVKQGKEAVVYHADGGKNNVSSTILEDGKDGDDWDKKAAATTTAIGDNDGFDVAIKVFKRIKEFRGRGEYVDGDPRYAGRPFRSLSDRQQLEVWTEKEFRNLKRAHRSKVPVPNPIYYKENVIFMRFLGENGWPAPQIREIQMRKGSSKWHALYEQVMESVAKLFQEARLVHGDLSEYNILVAPQSQVDHCATSVRHQRCLDDVEEKMAAENNNENKNSSNNNDDLQTVLIDFGQSVEVRHPKAEELLRRDLERVIEFFTKQGVTKTMSIEDAMAFVIGDKSTFLNIENINMPAQSELCT
jgi:serine/threonine-protein kinase RIO1